MKFMIIRKADANTEAGTMPSEALITAMMAYNAELAKAGALVDGVGLRPSSAGARVTFKDGQPTVIDGPFTETKELIAGYTLIDVQSKAEAIAWVKRWPREDGDVQLEIRQLFEIEDFGEVAIEAAKGLK